jgi:GntR family transcriptional regulator, uxu operon transcriptional repressor
MIGWLVATETTTPAVPPPRAYGDELAGLILSSSASAAAQLGGRLPTERALAASLGVTRTMVRHALAILEAEGRVSREVGRGTFLREPAPRRAGADRRDGVHGDDISPADVMAARRLLEPQVLPLVVAWATNRDFDEMRRCLERGGAAESAEEFEVWDFALHHAIVAAGRNQLVLRMYEAVERARKGQLWGSLKRRNDSRERREIYQGEHVRLVDALAARELGLAVETMETHLARVEANLLGSTPAAAAG